MSSLLSTPSGSTGSPAKVVLTTTSDWDVWIHLIKQSAEDQWQYINPDLPEPTPLPEEPAKPNPVDFPDDAQGMARWTKTLSLYNIEAKEHRLLKEKVSRIASFIRATISVENQEYIIQDDDSVHSMLVALKSRFAPTDIAREKEYLAQYRSLFHWKKSMDLDRWLDQWVYTWKKLQGQGCPDVSGNRPLWDFFNAIKSIDTNYAENMLAMNLRLQAINLPLNTTLEQEVKNFRQFRRYNLATKASSNTSLAMATFNNQTPSQQPQTSENCPFCALPGHKYTRCWYINEKARRFQSWTPTKVKMAEIQGKIDADPKLQEMVKEVKRNDPPSNNTSTGSFAASFSTSTASTLINKWILDTGSDVHVSNTMDGMINLRKPSTESTILAGSTQYNIEAFGTSIIDVDTPQGLKTMTLLDVAFVPGFLANLVSMARLANKGVDLSLQRGLLTKNKKPLAKLKRQGGHWVLSTRLSKAEPSKPSTTVSIKEGSSLSSSLSSSTNEQFIYLLKESPPLAAAINAAPGGLPSKPLRQKEEKEESQAQDEAARVSQKSIKDLEMTKTWHTRLGHPNDDILRHLATAVDGIPQFSVNKGVCEVCRLSKAKQQISRSMEKEDDVQEPFHRVSCDIIQFQEGYNGDEYVVHFEDFLTKYNVLFCVPQRSGFSSILETFLNLVHTQWKRQIQVLRMDNETAAVDSDDFQELCSKRGLRVEYSAPRTPAQNGHAERFGRSIIEKARSMRLEANLPASLWPELAKTAAYLLNRTPTKALRWKTPMEALTGRKPTLRHLRTIGCKAYVLRRDLPRKDKLEARAFKGYLLGYDSRKIWRVWNPIAKTVSRSRDVTFDESQGFTPKDPERNELLTTSQQLNESLDFGGFHHQNGNALPDLSSDEEDPDTIVVYRRTSPNRDDGPTASQNSKTSATQPSNLQHQLLTPQPSPEPTTAQIDESTQGQNALPTSHGAAPSPSTPGGVNERGGLPTEATPPPPATTRSRRQGQDESSTILPEGSKRTRKPTKPFEGHLTTLQDDSVVEFHMAFSAALNTSKDDIPPIPPTTERLHRDSMPPEPRSYQQLKRHQYSKEFWDAMHKEVHQLNQKGTYRVIRRTESKTRPLPLLWVYKYKFDNDGYLVKFKARLCVRGDLQVNTNDNYAATVAARTFRALMAITAAFDLEIYQLDAVNAFLNSNIDEETTTEWPLGFGDQETSWLLLKALYGLKQAPLLWYNHLTATLRNLGLKEVPGVNCLFTNERLLLFFYVDDIILLYRREDAPHMEAFLQQLKTTYDLTVSPQATWFLGLRILRDRPNLRLYLCQDSYIDKIVSRYNINLGLYTRTQTPLAIEALQPNEGIATPRQIQAYQQRIGSINFAATMTRPDIAKACSTLAQFLKNPSARHLDAADRVIAYLGKTRCLAILYTGETSTNDLGLQVIPFQAYSDAAFADNVDRKSSDGYLFMLYGGPIDWKAAKQATVTTSSTEAELLALSAAMKDVKWWQRLYKAIRFNLEGTMHIYSDNQQTIRLLTSPNPQLTTKLRHVDIHQHWLRQEVQNGDVYIDWVPTNEMKADGFTKALPPQAFTRFIHQLNLVDIQDAIEDK